MCDAAERSIWWTTNEEALAVSHQGGRCERIKTNTGGVAGRAGGGAREINHADDDDDDEGKGRGHLGECRGIRGLETGF